MNEPAAIETAIIWRMLRLAPWYLRSPIPLLVARSSMATSNTTSLSDSEVVLQRVGVAAILFPDERESAALGRAQVEFYKRIRRNGLVEIDAEHHHVIVAAGKLVDDLARDDGALVITAQAGLHPRADQGLCPKYPPPPRRPCHVHTRCRGEHSPPTPRIP